MVMAIAESDGSPGSRVQFGPSRPLRGTRPAALDLVVETGLTTIADQQLRYRGRDALAMALLEAKGFTARDFGVLHPGRKLGAKLP